jgi:two-component system cell cycle sensor histidine kinase/response regulator CckA
MQDLHKPAHPLRVLLLEDDPANARLLLRTLADAGFSIMSAIARNAKEFKQRIESQSFDLIVGNYCLPGWNGLDAVKWLRSSEILTPFILVTNTLEDELAIECIKCGADDYVANSNLGRLPLAVKRALVEQQLRFERDWAEKELRESEHQYRLLFHSNPHPMWVFDSETLRFMAVNDAAVRHYGYSVSEFLSMTIKDIRPAEDVPRILDTMKAGIFGIVEHDQELWRHKKRDGTIIDVQVSSRPITFRAAKAILVLAVDVTEQRKLEQQFRYAQKMEAIARLAGGVAHDFNNLLMVISSHTQLMVEYHDQPARIDRYAKHIATAIDKASLLTKQLLAFGRKQIQDLRVLDLNAVVHELSIILSGLLGSGINIVVRTWERPCLVYSDRSQIEQVLMNLVVNARDAMPEGGTLTIETECVELAPEYFPTHKVEAKPGDYVMLAVTDSGTGIDHETQSHIFEPFFTTKEPGRGTGLGLSTVYGIVKQNSGYIWLYSEVGVGTTLKIYLPCTDNGVEMSKESPAAAEEPDFSGSETILVVEDEVALRLATCEYLRSQGYTVLAAGNASEAIRTARDREDIALLITDLVMPGIGGLQLAAMLIEQRPRLQVVYMSGYTEQAAKAAAIGRPRFYLQKPFTLAALAAVARRALNNREKVPSQSMI